MPRRVACVSLGELPHFEFKLLRLKALQMETKVTTKWQDWVEQAQSGFGESLLLLLNGDSGPEACLIKGLLIFESDPETGKELFAKAGRSSDIDIANQAAIYEARTYEYLGQPDEGKILIREVLKRRDLKPYLRAHALFVFAVFQLPMPKRAMTTLNRIKINVLSASMKGRVFLLRGKVQADLGKLDAALIEYSGAAAYFDEAGHTRGVAHAHNNRASVYRKLKRFTEAHESVDKAISLVPKTDPFIPQFLDQKARVFLAEKKYVDAERVAIKAVGLVHGTDRQRVLCENLCTLGLAYAGLKNYSPAGAAFVGARDIADHLDNPDLLLTVAKARRDAALIFLRDSEIEMAETALMICDGAMRAAAKKIDFSPAGLRKLLKRNSRDVGTSETTNRIYKSVN